MAPRYAFARFTTLAAGEVHRSFALVTSRCVRRPVQSALRSGTRATSELARRDQTLLSSHSFLNSV